jgi:uncharacterized Zn finger protein (UPF0148 family)
LSVLQANCPSCAAPIEFQNGSTVVLVCPFCRSAVARTDRNVEDLGKVADIAESESPLKLGLKGTYQNHRFTLTGRAQLKHELGGFWDEWYATFSNGWVAWLAEAQGKFYLTFYQPTKKGLALPSFERLQLGQMITELPTETPLMVTEKGTATAIAADGEIPYRLTPNERSDYADLSGQNNAFGTIDYSFDPPWAFVGQQVSLAEIGLADAKPVQREARRVSATAMNCPNCGGALSLAAPDKTERVACPYCSSLLDVNQGNLRFLHALKPSPSPHEFVLPIGAEGTFTSETKYKIIGAVVRSVTIEDVQYFWHEYLLYDPLIGFRWLVHSDNHWNFVEPINAAEVFVSESSGKGSATYNGKSYKIFQDATATVEYVKGEFYWRVEQGETARAIDYVAAPLMLSCEMSRNEINWSLGTYVPNAEIEKAFGVAGWPKPWSLRRTSRLNGSFYYTVRLNSACAAVRRCAVYDSSAVSARSAHQAESFCRRSPNAQDSASRLSASRSISKAIATCVSRRNAPVNNSGADLDVDLINEQNNEVESVNIPVEYYLGSDSDGSVDRRARRRRTRLYRRSGGKIYFARRRNVQTLLMRFRSMSRSSKTFRAASISFAL